MGRYTCLQFGRFICRRGDREAGAPAEEAEIRKISKYSVLSQSYFFQPMLLKMPCVINSSAFTFSMPLAVASLLLAVKNMKVLFSFNESLSPLSVSLVQLVKALAAPTHVNSCVQKVRVRSPEQKLDSGFHPSGIGKMSSN